MSRSVYTLTTKEQGITFQYFCIVTPFKGDIASWSLARASVPPKAESELLFSSKCKSSNVPQMLASLLADLSSEAPTEGARTWTIQTLQ